MGCYSFANHVLRAPPGAADGLRDPDASLEAFGAAFDRAGLAPPELVFAEGCAVEGDDTSGFAEAVAAAAGRRRRGRRRG